MPLKTWILDKVNRVNELFVRNDLPPRAEEPRASETVRAGEWREEQRGETFLSGGEHLGIYAPLIDAIRDELERFVVAHVRHHLAIAEHDRFLLTSIEIEAEEGGEPRELLLRFSREFKPEQIKRFLTREVIGGLPNASAIDLSQFSGLRVPAAETAAVQEEDEYAELLKVLGSPAAGADRSAYRVRLSGRWTEGPAAAGRQMAPAAAAAGVPTPLAGLHAEIDVGDARGERRLELPAVQPGRRYVVGKDSGCDIVLDGTFTSRRHCEIWFDQGSWWVLDAGSTNGIRVESASGVRRSRTRAESSGSAQPLELLPGERIVLSALAQGDAHDYPWLALRTPPPAAPMTPIATAAATPATPVTPVVTMPPVSSPWSVQIEMASGLRSVALHAEQLPVSVGRSRSQTLVIDRAHESVSGHHLDIAALDEAGAEVVVHGANGVTLEGALHGPGSRLRWRVGQPLQLGQPAPQEPRCVLRLSCRTQAQSGQEPR